MAAWGRRRNAITVNFEKSLTTYQGSRRSQQNNLSNYGKTDKIAIVKGNELDYHKDELEIGLDTWIVISKQKKPAYKGRRAGSRQGYGPQ